MKTAPDENQFQDLFDKMQVTPGNRFYRRMKKAAWTPAGIARRRAFTVTGVTLALVAALLAFTPQGRALAQNLIHFFSRSTSDFMPVPTPEPLVWVDLTPSVIPPTPTPRTVFAECGDFNNPTCSTQQIRDKVRFTVWELGTIPAGMYFAGATGGPDQVAVLYDIGDTRAGVMLVEEPWTEKSATPWKIGASAIVEPVQIGDITGEYVRGSWSGKLGEPDYFWDPNAGSQTLHWIKQDVFISMEGWGPAALVDKNAFIELAENLTINPISARSTPLPPTATPGGIIWYQGNLYNLSLAQAAQQAGFPVAEPSRLPSALSFLGAAYQQDKKIVRVLYNDTQMSLQLAGPNGLMLSEQPATDPNGCSLCGFVTGEYFGVEPAKSGMTVGKNATIETVQIGNGTGQYVEGFWAKTDFGWVWTEDPIISGDQILRWQANGMAFELQYLGITPLTKADLVTIAESMK